MLTILSFYDDDRSDEIIALRFGEWTKFVVQVLEKAADVFVFVPYVLPLIIRNDKEIVL
jgi:hypothetical protein